MTKKTSNTIGKADGRRFVKFYYQLLDSPKFYSLSGHAVKSLMYLASQFNGHNNGDLGIAWKVAKAKGLTSNNSLRRGVLELVEAGFVTQTRQGGRNRCSLFALSWFPIDHCNGKLDVPATKVAPLDWRSLDRLSEPNRVQLAPNGVQSTPIAVVKSVH